MTSLAIQIDALLVTELRTMLVRVGALPLIQAAMACAKTTPDVNACAAPSIYKARFPHGGDVTILVSVKN
jgi:hypothetical protein